jgi:phosphatidylglycerophosphatase A
MVQCGPRPETYGLIFLTSEQFFPQTVFSIILSICHRVKVRIARLLATLLGIGYVSKGGGTLAAIVCCVVWGWVGAGEREHMVDRTDLFLAEALTTFLLLVTGIWSAGVVEEQWGKDSHRIVIDEAAGMCLSLCAIPLRWPYILAGLALFRFFDIAKPLFIRKAEKLRGGWGVMLDDMLAGLYANVVLQILVFFKPW